MAVVVLPPRIAVAVVVTAILAIIWMACNMVALWIIRDPHSAERQDYSAIDTLAALRMQDDHVYTIPIVLDRIVPTEPQASSNPGLTSIAPAMLASTPARVLAFRQETGETAYITVPITKLNVVEGPQDQRTIIFHFNPGDESLSGTDTRRWIKNGTVFCAWCGHIRSELDVRNTEAYQRASAIALGDVLSRPGVIDRINIVLPPAEYMKFKAQL